VSRYALSLGSNLGDRLSSLRLGYSGLESLGRVVGVSGLYETAPRGGPEQGPYLNSVVILETGLTPSELLDRCQSIEAGAGRLRAERWGPRSLDIDIVTSDGLQIDTDTLHIPHPRAADREFVLRPLVDVWPLAPLGEGVTAAHALSRVQPQGVDLLSRRWAVDSRVGTWLVVIQVMLLGAIGLAIFADGSRSFGDGPVPRVLGAVIAICGVGLGLAAGRALGPALVARPEPRRGADLVERGPFGQVRHPIYGSIVLVVAGVAVALDSRVGLAGALVLLAFFTVKARFEEHRLRIRYPGYAAYRERVRRWFIPGVL